MLCGARFLPGCRAVRVPGPSNHVTAEHPQAQAETEAPGGEVKPRTDSRGFARHPWFSRGHPEEAPTPRDAACWSEKRAW